MCRQRRGDPRIRRDPDRAERRESAVVDAELQSGCV